MARSCLLPPLSWKLRGPEQLLEAVVCLSQQTEGLEWETAVSLSPSDEREATSPGLTPRGPQSRTPATQGFTRSHPVPHTGPRTALLCSLPSTPPYPRLAALLAALTRGQVYLLGSLPGSSSGSPCHCHAATGPQQMGLGNGVERHRDPHLPGTSACWVGAGLLWAGLGRARLLRSWPQG